MALSELIPNNCPMYIVGVIIIAVPDITHCNVVKAHIDAKGIPLLIKPPLAPLPIIYIVYSFYRFYTLIIQYSTRKNLIKSI